MSMILNKDHDEDVEVNIPHPGQRLHVARLNAKLELVKVAAQMHLSEETLLAVEADEYDSLPTRVFVRGYYRNYARLVGLPEEEILAELDEAWPEEGADITIRPVGRHIKPEVRSSHSLVRLFTWLVILGLLSLVVIWWVGYLKPRGQSAVTAPTGAAEEAAIEPGTLALPVAPAGEAADAPVLALPAEQSATSVPAKSLTEPGDNAQGQDAPPETTAVLPQTIASPVIDTAPAIIEPPAVAESKVGLRFKGDSWVDIRDSTRTFRLFGIIKAGSFRELGGKPPYSVLLGNSSAVEITVNGNLFDQRRYNKGNVARFTLDVDSLASP